MKTRQERFAAVVIGSGIAGGAVARELCRAGVQTLLVEQGPHVLPQAAPRDPIASLERNPLLAPSSRFPVYLQQRDDEAPVRVPEVLGRNVGGSSVRFGGNATRFVAAEFQQRARGRTLGLEVEDWPLTYEELEPWYARAERELGVAGLHDANPHGPPRSGPYPLPPYPRSSAGAIFENACRSAGMHPFPAPKLINTRPYGGRPACFHQGLCSGYACHSDAKASSLVTTLREAQATGRLTLWSDTAVVRVEADARAVRGILVRDLEGVETFVRAERVFVCCNAVGTARLLLASASDAQPHGLLNDDDLVGRFIDCPSVTSIQTLHPHPLGYYQNAYTRGCDDLLAWREGYPLPLGFGLTEMQEGGPTPAIRYGGDAFPALGTPASELLATHPQNILSWTALGTGLAKAENRVLLHPETRDAWGLPAPVVRHVRDPAVLAMLQLQRKALDRLSNHSDFERRWSTVAGPLGFVPVLMAGGCRMGSDPASSLVDGFGRSHRYPELFVVGSATFPTSGHAPPSLTIAALALRTVAHALAA